MSNEAKVTIGLSIIKNNLRHLPQTKTFNADVAGQKGPVPGAITVALAGTDIDLSQLTTPGLCQITNIDEDNYVEYGIKEPSSGFFYPLGELLPGESYIIRLSRNIGEEYTNTGTGTSAPTNTLHFKANTAPVNVIIEAFEV